MQLRPYQEQAIQEIRQRFAAGQKKVLLHLATGGGKTVIFSRMLIDASVRGNRCGMIVRGKQLVNQASDRLFREHVPHGVLMSNHWNKNYGAPIQICSIDTLLARSLKPEFKLLVIDEAHLAVTGGFKDLIQCYPDAYVVAVTATPFTKEPLEHLAESVVNPITTSELIEQGFLVPPRYYAPSKPNLDGVQTRKGDYVVDQLEERMGGLTGDIVEHWRELAESRPTICFAVNIRHSESIVAQFNAAGIPAEHVEGNHSETERKNILERLRSGETKVVSNVGVLCTGVDLPFVSCLVMARPTKSYNLFIQQAGRGTRPFDRKSDFILLDHAGNVLRHGFITQEREVVLDGIKKEKIDGDQPKTCLQCYTIYVAGQGCPNGCEPPQKIERNGSDILLDETGRLEELVEMPFGAEVHQYLERQKSIQKRRGYKKRWLWYRMQEKFGDEIADATCGKQPERPWFLGVT